MRHYELVVILSPMLNQEQATDAWSRIKGFITGRSAGITHEERWGTRRLAYPIRKGSHQFLEGSYHLTRFHTERPFNQELETYLRLDEQVLRSLVVATEPPAAESAATEAALPEAGAEAAVAEPVVAAGEAPPEMAVPTPGGEPDSSAGETSDSEPEHEPERGPA